MSEAQHFGRPGLPAICPSVALEPGVTVVIPVKNRRTFVCEAIDSALSQDIAGVEVVVVDDGSTDGTADEVRTKYADRPVLVVRNERAQGPAGARNCGRAHVRRQFTAFLDSDDLFLPGHLAACIGLMVRHEDVDVVFGPARYECDGIEIDYMRPGFERKLACGPAAQDAPDAIVFSTAFFEHLIGQGCFFNLSSVAFRTAAVSDLMNERLRIAEDYEFWMRLSTTHLFACLKAPQIIYRVHGENVSLAGESSDAAHSSALLHAYTEVLGYERVPANLRRLVRARMAQVLFDWGFHARMAGRYSEAIRHHLGSLAKGMRRRNLAALAKIGLEMSLGANRLRG